MVEPLVIYIRCSVATGIRHLKHTRQTLDHSPTLAVCVTEKMSLLYVYGNFGMGSLIFNKACQNIYSTENSKLNLNYIICLIYIAILVLKITVKTFHTNFKLSIKFSNSFLWVHVLTKEFERQVENSIEYACFIGEHVIHSISHCYINVHARNNKVGKLVAVCTRI